MVQEQRQWGNRDDARCAAAGEAVAALEVERATLLEHEALIRVGAPVRVAFR
ncbi:hypothetical protein D3C83_273800 [compost metagenome]